MTKKILAHLDKPFVLLTILGVLMVAFFAVGFIFRPPPHVPPHIPIHLKPTTAGELLASAKTTPVAALLNMMAILEFTSFAAAVCFSPLGKPWGRSIVMYLLWACATGAAWQVLMLYGVHSQIYFAMWRHILADVHGFWSTAFAYVLPVSTIVGIVWLAVVIVRAAWGILRWTLRTSRNIARFNKTSQP